MLTFASRSDRDYFGTEDPAHAAFRASLAGRVAIATVADFDATSFASAEPRGTHARLKSDDAHVRAV